MDGVDVKKITDETFTKDKPSEKGRDFFNAEGKVSDPKIELTHLSIIEEGSFKGTSWPPEERRCRSH